MGRRPSRLFVEFRSRDATSRYFPTILLGGRFRTTPRGRDRHRSEPRLVVVGRGGVWGNLKGKAGGRFLEAKCVEVDTWGLKTDRVRAGWSVAVGCAVLCCAGLWTVWCLEKVALHRDKGQGLTFKSLIVEAVGSGNSSRPGRPNFSDDLGVTLAVQECSARPPLNPA